MSIPIPYISRDSAILLSIQEVESDTCSLFIKSLQCTRRLVISEFKRDGRVERFYLLTNRKDRAKEIVADYI